MDGMVGFRDPAGVRDGDDGTMPFDARSRALTELLSRGSARGHITRAEFDQLLPPGMTPAEELEEAEAALDEAGIPVVETGETEAVVGPVGFSSPPRGAPLPGAAGQANPQTAATGTADPDEVDTVRTDDPVRMFLRDMGAAEPLTREGEIAVAQRIEAGRDAMLAGLCESPTTFATLQAWYQGLVEGKVPLREVIEIEAAAAAAHALPTYIPLSAIDEAAEPGAPVGAAGGGAAPGHTTLEERLKPETLTGLAGVLAAGERMKAAGKDEAQRLEERRQAVALIRGLRLREARIDALVAPLKEANRRLNPLDGRAMRLGMAAGLTREAFIELWDSTRAGGVGGTGWPTGGGAGAGSGSFVVGRSSVIFPSAAVSPNSVTYRFPLPQCSMMSTGLFNPVSPGMPVSLLVIDPSDPTVSTMMSSPPLYRATRILFFRADPNAPGWLQYVSAPFGDWCWPKSNTGLTQSSSGWVPTGYCGTSNGSTPAVGLPPLST